MILLISDLHLIDTRPDITRAFLDLLNGRARSAQALYILGDFFEAWIGDDGMTPFQRSICLALLEKGQAKRTLAGSKSIDAQVIFEGVSQSCQCEVGDGAQGYQISRRLCIVRVRTDEMQFW